MIFHPYSTVNIATAGLNYHYSIINNNISQYCTSFQTVNCSTILQRWQFSNEFQYTENYILQALTECYKWLIILISHNKDLSADTFKATDRNRFHNDATIRVYYCVEFDA